MSPHRVLLVGAGNIARAVHMPAFLELPSDFTVVGAVDADPTAAAPSPPASRSSTTPPISLRPTM
ncbi:hypothetical protein [Streptomyces atratus]|uniref:Oxidoreductase family, NAD-binding Rossmann fold n=1 Tax=Streptomyces atratus TaxID=1893 RepID=A0A2Z5J7F0_STRAR|nr:hypothetical protein [Streptomyces atratus]AXE76247.1 hypothetical protein C5746_03935 [Streptomyces atratus]